SPPVSSSGRRLVIDNCLQVGGGFLLGSGRLGPRQAAFVRLARNTCVVEEWPLGFWLELEEQGYREGGRPVTLLRVEASASVFDARSVFHFSQHQPGKLFPPRDAEPLLRQLVGWQGQRNLYALSGPFLQLSTKAKGPDPASP